jgi:hypothetical protein
MRSVAEALSLSHGTVFSTGTSWGIFGQLNDIHMVIDIN